jgi:3,2-trans-enoyl-CoA isomerase
MLDIIDHDSITELKMNRPPANALTTPLVTRMIAALDEALASGAQAVMLSGREGMFSGGLDVPELLQLDRPAVHEFWAQFMLLNRRLAGCPVPVVAVIGGHSPAGGAVLAAHCDYRIAAEGSFKIGFNEVQVGLPIPATILRTFSSLVGARTAARLATTGRLISMSSALDIGLVDELVAPDRIVERALEWAGELISLPPIAMNQTRLLLKSDLLAALDAADDVAVTTDYWFSDETQAAMQRLVESLRK